MFKIVSKFSLSAKVVAPISVLLVVAMSKRQNWSSPHILIASSSSALSLKFGWKSGINEGSKYVKRFSPGT